MTKRAIIIGANSDIAKGIMPMLERDGYELVKWARGDGYLRSRPWDLFVNFIGTVEPVKMWNDMQEWTDFDNALISNLQKPFWMLRHAWDKHKRNATVCFFAGSNPQMIMPGYIAYNTGKMALLKLVEQLDYETPDAKFFALGPGIVLTKIHEPSMNWENPKLKAALDEGKSTPIERIYDCLQWCVAQPKEVVGGRNICVSDWYGKDHETLAKRLEYNPDLFKLRRVEK